MHCICYFCSLFLNLNFHFLSAPSPPPTPHGIDLLRPEHVSCLSHILDMPVFFVAFNLFLVFSSTGRFKTWLDCSLTFWQKYLIHFFTSHHITRCINVWFSPVDVNCDHRVKIVTARSLLWSCFFFFFFCD